MLLFIGVFTTIHTLLEVRAKYVARTTNTKTLLTDDQLVLVMPQEEKSELISSDDAEARARIVIAAHGRGELFDLVRRPVAA